jgi:4-hydroxymandelate oxidase
MRVEDIADKPRPVWFQLYVQPDRGFTRDLVQRAEASGCRRRAGVGVSSHGARNREFRAQASMPERELPNLPGKNYLDPTLTWKDIEWLRGFARTPVLLKGILNPDDADIAARSGVAGIVVSNHGARNLDTAPATIDASGGGERVAGRMPVLVDGGTAAEPTCSRRSHSSDGVQIGRPYLYGLGVAGADGVKRVVEILGANSKWR